MQFKHEILRNELFHLDATGPRLRAIVIELDFFFRKIFIQELVATCIRRTEEEQNKLYPEFSARIGLVRHSLHLDRPCRAVDLCSRDLNPEEIEVLKNYFECWRGDLPGYAFLINDRRNAFPHIHLQVGRET